VKPLAAQAEDGRRLLIASFTAAEPPSQLGREKPARGAVPAGRLEELEATLVTTRETLQATIEDQQASNEELQSANEELQSANEELQSANEELETSKEELQSLNEEMVTVNAELQAKIDELAGTQNDLKNLLDSTSVGTIFLDERLAIRRFSREATALFRLMPTDLGRPLADIKANFDAEGIAEDAQAVLDSLLPRERQVQVARRRYLVRILIYRTIENVIAGVVMTFTDLTDLIGLKVAARSPRTSPRCKGTP
jgi:two-component system CheB/CheR fusion protein